MYFMKPINHRNVVAKIAKDMKTVGAENTTLWNVDKVNLIY